MAAGASPLPVQHVFRVFISYASEDLVIANAVASCFKTALPDFFAEVNIDKDFLEAGPSFQTQIETKLQATNVFVIVYSGVEKPSFSYTGWELGYFDRIMRTDSTNRKKIALYLNKPPDLTAYEQGIALGLSKEQLTLQSNDFETNLAIKPDDPLCKEIENWQKIVADNIEQMGLARPHYRDEKEAQACVRNLKIAIFKHLKTTIETIVKPQKQIIIRVKGSAPELADGTIPPDATIRTLGSLASGASMDIFGLSDEPTTWGKFLESTSEQPYAESWRDAITTVVLSTFPDRVNVDNSQVILAVDGKTSYRVILTTATKFYDDYREYNLYFVQVLERDEHGDPDTTYLLKGLELVCRFRSAFLEPASEFLG